MPIVLTTTPPVDAIQWKVAWKLEKFNILQTIHGITGPYEVIDGEGNLLMYGGASALWQRLIGTGVTAFDNSNAYIGVGNSTTAAAATQTDLQGASKHREAMDATYPTHTDGTTSGAASIVFKSTFETADANFAWEEWGIFNASTSGRMLNRKVTSLGTKTSSDEWAFTVTITLA